ncbi:MAG: hypothetical protein PVS3B3_10340 [Ktedonobacteraceae bacterium]
MLYDISRDIVEIEKRIGVLWLVTVDLYAMSRVQNHRYAMLLISNAMLNTVLVTYLMPL